MASRRPLVIAGGALKELPTGDNIPIEALPVDVATTSSVNTALDNAKIYFESTDFGGAGSLADPLTILPDDGKVDKVAGKGLSTNDFDNTDQQKVDAINITGQGLQFLADNGTYKTINMGVGGAIDLAGAVIADAVTGVFYRMLLTGGGVTWISTNSTTAPAGTIDLGMAVIADSATLDVYRLTLTGGGTMWTPANARTPSGFVATPASASQINLTWNPDTDATFTVQRATNAGFTAGLTTVYTGTASTYNNTGLITATKYFYRIKAAKAHYQDSTAYAFTDATTN